MTLETATDVGREGLLLPCKNCCCLYVLLDVKVVNELVLCRANVQDLSFVAEADEARAVLQLFVHEVGRAPADSVLADLEVLPQMAGARPSTCSSRDPEPPHPHP